MTEELLREEVSICKSKHASGQEFSFIINGVSRLSDEEKKLLINQTLINEYPELILKDWTVEVSDGLSIAVAETEEAKVSLEIPDDVSLEIPDDVSLQIPDDVAPQIPADISPQIPATVEADELENSPAAKRQDMRATPQKFSRSKNIKKRLSTCFLDVPDGIYNGKLTNKVSVYNLPLGFSKDVLLYEINRILWEKKIFEKGVKAVSQCTIGIDNSVMVECSSIQVAVLVSALENIDYEDIPIVMKHVESDPDDEVFQYFSNKLEVLNVPTDFSEDALLYELNRCLRKKGALESGQKGALRCSMDKNNSVIVECATIEIAKAISEMPDIEFEDVNLVIRHLVSDPDEVSQRSPTNKLEVLNLPADFSVDALLYEINRCLRTKGALEKGQKGALRCSMDKNNSVIVECATIEIAKAVSDMPDFEYEDVTLEFRLVESERKEIFKIPTNEVVVENLPPDFSEDVLLHELNRALRTKGILKKGHKAALECCRGQNESVIVKFDSVESAAEVCKVQDLEYGDDKLQLLQLVKNNESLSTNEENSSNNSLIFFDSGNFQKHTIQSDEEPEVLVHIKDSCYVVISNIPFNFDKNEFLKFINNEMAAASFIPLGANCIEKCVKVDTKSRTVTVEFKTCEEANLAVLMENIVYKSCKLAFRKVIASDVSTSEGHENQQYHEQCNSISIDSDEGTEIFIKMLIKHRDAFPKSGSHEPVLESIRSKLVTRKVCASTATLRAKRRSLLEQYRNNKRLGKSNHKYFVAGRIMFDNADVNLVKNTKFDPDNDDLDNSGEDDQTVFNASLVKFSSVAAWTCNASAALIRICIDNNRDYHKPIPNSRFWKDISNLLVEQRFFYSPDQCQNRMKVLTAAYKDFRDLTNRTGAPGIQQVVPDDGMRLLMDLMADLLQGNVTVEPKITVAAGLCSEKTNSAQGAPCGNEETSSGVRIGKSRPTSLKRNPSIAERKIAAMERRAAALEKIASTFH